MESDLTVITITFNNLEELKQTINSVFKLNCTRFVINGGNCSETLFYLKDNNISSISEKDNGIADAFNKGVRNVETKYLHHLNSGDILIDQDYHKKALEILEKNPKIDYVHACLKFEDPVLGEVVQFPSFNGIGEGMPFLHPTLIIRKTVFEKVGLFNESFKIAMDYDLAVRMEKHNIQGYFLEGVYPVLMDGDGVSTINELDSIKECKVSLVENGLYSKPHIRIGFYKRLLKFYIRRFINIFSPRLMRKMRLISYKMKTGGKTNE
jgi:GT2 family glycosyltransferase